VADGDGLRICVLEKRNLIRRQPAAGLNSWKRFRCPQVSAFTTFWSAAAGAVGAKFLSCSLLVLVKS
jgi:hypothetical protein